MPERSASDLGREREEILASIQDCEATLRRLNTSRGRLLKMRTTKIRDMLLRENEDMQETLERSITLLREKLCPLPTRSNGNAREA